MIEEKENASLQNGIGILNRPYKYYDLPCFLDEMGQALPANKIVSEFSRIPKEVDLIVFESAMISFVDLPIILLGFKHLPGCYAIDFTNCLSRYDLNEVTQLFAALPNSVKLLIIDVCLEHLNSGTLADFFASIPEQIDCLYIDERGLINAPMELLIKGFAGVPKHVNKIDFGFWPLPFTAQQLARFLPDHIRTVVVNGTEYIVKNLKEQNQLGNQRLHHFFGDDTQRVNFNFIDYVDTSTLEYN